MTSLASRVDGPRPPSLLDALLPIVVLIGLLALTITLFGVSATDGPLQVALLLGAAFASLVAFKNGYTVDRGRGHLWGHLPFCFFNLISTLLDIVYGYIGFKVPQAEAPWEDDPTPVNVSAGPIGDSHG